MSSVEFQHLLVSSPISNTLFSFIHPTKERTKPLDLLIMEPDILRRDVIQQKRYPSITQSKKPLSIQGIRGIIQHPNPTLILQSIQQLYPHALQEWSGFITLVLMEIIEKKIHSPETIKLLEYLPLIWQKSEEEWEMHWNRARNYTLEIQQLALVDYFEKKCRGNYSIPLQTRRFIEARNHKQSQEWVDNYTSTKKRLPIGDFY
jgi:hypothetical protein